VVSISQHRNLIALSLSARQTCQPAAALLHSSNRWMGLVTFIFKPLYTHTYCPGGSIGPRASQNVTTERKIPANARPLSPVVQLKVSHITD